jgi:cob(I)alamin adenosyltransferase
MSSSIFKGTGDDGYTGLLGKGRVPKYHPRPEAYGAVDEASATLGLARALTESPDIAQVIKTIQRDLVKLMTELAVVAPGSAKFVPFKAARVTWLERQIGLLEQQVDLPSQFVLGGDSPAGAAFDLARATVRRAERHVAKLLHEGEISNSELLRYLNRLSSLCFLLFLNEYKVAGIEGPSLASGSE